jgi:hypothetical protein
MGNEQVFDRVSAPSVSTANDTRTLVVRLQTDKGPIALLMAPDVAELLSDRMTKERVRSGLVTSQVRFEGDPPYDLPSAQTASARPEGEIVELILTVSVPAIQPTPVQVRVPMTWKTAQSLGAQLNIVSMAAEERARKLGR